MENSKNKNNFTGQNNKQYNLTVFSAAVVVMVENKIKKLLFKITNRTISLFWMATTAMTVVKNSKKKLKIIIQNNK